MPRRAMLQQYWKPVKPVRFSRRALCHPRLVPKPKEPGRQKVTNSQLYVTRSKPPSGKGVNQSEVKVHLKAPARPAPARPAPTNTLSRAEEVKFRGVLAKSGLRLYL